MLNVTITLCKQEANSGEAFAGLTVYLPGNTKNSLANICEETHFTVEPTVLNKIIDLLQQSNGVQSPYKPQNAFGNVSGVPIQPHMLTSKEKQVLQLLAKGYSYKMIAGELKKSVETIRVQLKKIYKKLQVNSNTSAILKFQSLVVQGYSNAV